MKSFHDYREISRLNTYRTQFTSMFFIMIMSFLCLIQSVHANPDWIRDRDYVKLIQKEGSEPNDHPQLISPDTIRMALSAVEIDTKNRNQFFGFAGDTLLFDDSTLNRLDKSISDLLSQAKTDEDIVFHITSRHSKLIGGNNLITTARVFFVDGHLNLIFGEIHADLEKRYIRSGGDTRVSQKITQSELRDFHLKPGSRNKHRKNINLRVLNGLGTTLNKRCDWATIDIFNLIIKPTQKQNKNTYSNTQGNTIPPDTASPQEAASDKKSIEQRLMHLKDLYSKGIITEKAYNVKMQEILKEL